MAAESARDGVRPDAEIGTRRELQDFAREGRYGNLLQAADHFESVTLGLTDG